MTEIPSINIFIADEFKRAARALRKRYRNIDSDLEPLIEQLRNGDLPGDQISDLPEYIVYKVRVKNSDARRGKSGGYRVIYYILAPEATVLLRLYSKSDQDDVTQDDIRATIKKFQADTEST
jgi:mRNA-degrading endonuclease RelE of RelBE toxin-antitoxin system